MNTGNQPNRQVNSSGSHQERKAFRTRRQIHIIYALGCIFALIFLLFIILAATRNATPTNSAPSPTPTATPSPSPTVTTAPVSATPTATPTPARAAFTVTVPSAAIHCGNLAVVNRSTVYSATDAPSSAFEYGTLVNIYNKLSEAGEITQYYQLSSSSLQMRSQAYTALNAMLVGFYNANEGNNSILISSAWRSIEQQAAIGGSIAGGYSDSHLGLSCELKVHTAAKTGYLSDSTVYDWIYSHCAEYGFIVRYPEKDKETTGVSDYTYYFRYVGKPHAAVISEMNLCLESYISLLRGSYTSMEKPLSQAIDGTVYEIYYVPATGSETVLSIPEGYSYTVSGDNSLGFIVTCWQTK